MRWHERPMAQTALILAVMAGVLTIQNIFVTQLFPEHSANVAKRSANTLSKVAALPGCPVPALDGVEDRHPTFDATSATESDPFNNFGPAIAGLSRASESKQKFESVIPQGSIDASHIKLGNVIDGAIVLTEAMTPSGSYANQNAQRPSDGTVIKIKTTPGQVIRAPDSGRQISGSGDRYTGMVTYASADGVRFANSRNDKPTGNEGYNLYIWNINTNQAVISNYRRGHDEFKRKCFPQFRPGDVLGIAKGDFIYMALRDNGDFVTIRDTSWWDGKVTAGQAATGGGTTGANPTSTSTPTPVTGTPVATATPTSNASNSCPEIIDVYADWENNLLKAVKIHRKPQSGVGIVKLAHIKGTGEKKNLFIAQSPDSDSTPDLAIAEARTGNTEDYMDTISLTNNQTQIFMIETQLSSSQTVCMIKFASCQRNSPNATGNIKCSLASSQTQQPSNTPVPQAPTTAPTVGAGTVAPTIAPTTIPPTPTPTPLGYVSADKKVIVVIVPKVVCDGINSNGNPNMYCLLGRYNSEGPGPNFRIIGDGGDDWRGTIFKSKSESGTSQALSVILESYADFSGSINFLQFIVNGTTHIFGVTQI